MKKSFEKARRIPSGAYKHDLGQNFLYDRELLRSLVEATGITPEEDVLEIGTGAGTLTECLCAAAHQVVSVEVDHQLIPVLRLMEQRLPNLKLVEGDIRRLAFQELLSGLRIPVSVIANIPYNITSAILDLLLEHRREIREIDLMVQKEVAEKMMAGPSEENYGVLSLKCQYYYQLSVLAQVPAECFTPPPKVDSTFISLRLKQELPLRGEEEEAFFRLVKAGFNLRRKTLGNALKGLTDPERLAEALAALGHSPTARAEELSLEDWIALTKKLV